MVVAFLCVAVRWVFPSIILSRGIEKSVDNTLMLWYSYKAVETVYAPVAQLDRVFGYEPKGRGFESLLAYHFSCGKQAISSEIACFFNFSGTYKNWC